MRAKTTPWFSWSWYIIKANINGYIFLPSVNIYIIILYIYTKYHLICANACH